MPTHLRWEDVIDDPAEQNLFEALADSAWDFRTINGLMKATGLTEKQVYEIIYKYKPTGLIRESPIADERGRRLFTLGSRERSFGELFNIFRGSVTKSGSTGPTNAEE